MRNLAGAHYCDDVIQEELSQAGVPIVEVPRDDVHSEVPYTLEGRIRPFRFQRAWYYWVVKGPVSIEAAREMYANPIGRKDVRAGGDCTCPEPETQAEWFDPEGHKLWADPTGEQEAEAKRLTAKYGPYRDSGIFVPDLSKVPGAHAYVTCYHIDSQAGLNLFVETMRKYAQVPGKPVAGASLTVYERLLGPDEY